MYIYIYTCGEQKSGEPLRGGGGELSSPMAGTRELEKQTERWGIGLDAPPSRAHVEQVWGRGTATHGPFPEARLYKYMHIHA